VDGIGQLGTSELYLRLRLSIVGLTTCRRLPASIVHVAPSFMHQAMRQTTVAITCTLQVFIYGTTQHAVGQ